MSDYTKFEHKLKAEFVDKNKKLDSNSGQNYLNNTDKNNRKIILKLEGENLSSSASSAFIRFYIAGDYSCDIFNLRIYAIGDKKELLYELNFRNRGYYTVDITRHYNSGYRTFTIEWNDERNLEIENDFILYLSDTEDDFDRLRKLWSIKKNNNLDINREDVKKVIFNIDKRADKYYNKFIRKNNRRVLFEGMEIESAKQRTLVLRESYIGLDCLLQAYYTKGSKYEDDSELIDDIVAGLEFLYENYYNENSVEVANWWIWEIGVPKTLGRILSTLYDVLSPEKRMDYINAIYRFQPNPSLSSYYMDGEPKRKVHPSLGANRIDTCIVGCMLGALSKNPYLIERSRDGLDDVFNYVEKGDGFYRDGSFLQHGNIPYTMSYGLVLISGLIEISKNLYESPWRIVSNGYKNLINWLNDSYIPMVFDGQMIPITAGRSLARPIIDKEIGRSSAYGYILARLLISAAKTVDEKTSRKWLALAKRYIVENDFYDVFEHARDLETVEKMDYLLKTDKVEEASPLTFSKVFPAMDRLVHHYRDFAIGLAMNSNRIQNYEVMNLENLKGWYQGEGALYLMTKDAGQFDDAFFPTVNSYLLAGTTVDDTKRYDVDALNERNTCKILGKDFDEARFQGMEEQRCMPSDFVGGASLDNEFSVAVMDFKAHRTSLRAKKTWFFIKDIVIALGASISGEDSLGAKTVVENRMIRSLADNKLLVDAKALDIKLGEQKELVNPTWVHLEGNSKRSKGIGYVFLEKARVKLHRECRTGSWNDINKDKPDKEICRNYQSIIIEHGDRPENEKYAYMILAEKNPEEVREKLGKDSVKILRNDEEAQAIYDTSLDLLALNVFSDKGIGIDGIEIDGTCSLIIKNNMDSLDIAISDPSQKIDRKVRLVFKGVKYRKYKLPEEISFIDLEHDTGLEIDLRNSKGRTLEFSIKK